MSQSMWVLPTKDDGSGGNDILCVETGEVVASVRKRADAESIVAAHNQYSERPIIAGYKKDLIDMYEFYAEDDGLPCWGELTPEQQDAAISAVVSLHEDIDEYRAMVDAIWVYIDP